MRKCGHPAGVCGSTVPEKSSTLRPRNHTPGRRMSHRDENFRRRRSPDTNVRSRWNRNHRKPESAPSPFSRWPLQPTAVRYRHGLLLSDKKEAPLTRGAIWMTLQRSLLSEKKKKKKPVPRRRNGVWPQGTPAVTEMVCVLTVSTSISRSWFARCPHWEGAGEGTRVVAYSRVRNLWRSREEKVLIYRNHKQWTNK